MAIKKVGLIGWRGMVGSVLVQRMHDEGDFKNISPFYFSTSAVGQTHVDADQVPRTLMDAHSLAQLAGMDILISCQGGDYTKAVYPGLRTSGWQGYWIDAASAKRMDEDSQLILDPVNRRHIEAALNKGIKNFIGGNCSITLSILGLEGLFRTGLVEWMSLMTYQAASGAGAAQVRELLAQMDCLCDSVRADLMNPAVSVLTLLSQANNALQAKTFPTEQFNAPLAGGLIPWIDTDLGNGVSREEWKSEVETNKLLGLAPGTIGVDGLCVRVAALQSHSAAVTLKLKEDMPIEVLAELIKTSHEWVEYVPNNKVESLQKLSPAATTGSLKIAVGRLRKMNVGERLYSVFTVGDQLLWGAAEPLRRMLGILLAR